MVRVMVFNATFSFIGGANRNTQRKPSISSKSLINFITKYCIEYTSSERNSNWQR